MKCKYCNSEIEQDALFCPKCGKDLSKTNRCFKCGELLDSDSQFCPRCGAKQAFNKKRSGSGLWIWIVVAVLLFLIICGGLFGYYLYHRSSTDEVTMTTDSTTVLTSDSTNNAEVTGNLPRRNTPQRHTPVKKIGVKNLGYASYRGPLKGGKPHGVNGRITYRSAHLIDSRDPKGRVADPGDFIIGEFYDGRLVQGVWYDVLGRTKGSVIIGR